MYCKRILVLFGIISYLGLSGCASSNDPKPSPVATIKNPDSLTIKWKVNSLGKDNGGFVPVLDSDAVYTSGDDGVIFKIDANDGTVIKKIKTHLSLSSGTATSSDSIFVTTTDAKLVSIDKVSGDIKWSAQLSTISEEAPQVAGSIVVVKTNDAGISAYDTDSGKLLWVYQKANQALTLRVHNSFQVVPPNVLLLGQPGGVLVLLNLLNGNQIWSNDIAVPLGSTDLDKLTDIAIRPAVSGQNICVATYSGKIACLNAMNSSILWEKPFSSAQGVVLDQQNLYAVDNNGVVYAFDQVSGQQIWSNDQLKYRRLSAPALLNNDVLVMDQDGYINLFNRDTGDLVARVGTSLDGYIAYPIENSLRDKVILQSQNGDIIAVTQ